MSNQAGSRKDDRVTINKEFESFDAFIQEYVTNISRTGVFVKSKQPLPIGTRVNLKFTVIMDDIETIEGIGEVVRVQRALDAIEKDREVLQAYANLELSRGAKWSEIETRYRELLARFHPDKHRNDPERYRAALDVVAGLTRAYQVLYERVKR